MVFNWKYGFNKFHIL